MTRFAVRNYQQGIQRLLAACDEDLVGSSFRQDALRLDVTEDFYDGMRVEQEVLEGMLKACTMANLVGEETIRVAVAMGVIDESGVRRVEGVPHAQLVVMLP